MAGRAFLCAFLRKLRHKPADVNLFIKVYSEAAMQRRERLRWRSGQRAGVAGSILMRTTHVKRVGQHAAEIRGFSPGAPVSFHREVDRVG